MSVDPGRTELENSAVEEAPIGEGVPTVASRQLRQPGRVGSLRNPPSDPGRTVPAPVNEGERLAIVWFPPEDQTS